MGAQRSEVIAASVVVPAVVAAVSLELEEGLRVVLVRSLAEGVLGRMELGRGLRNEHGFGVGHLFLWKQFRFGRYSTM